MATIFDEMMKNGFETMLTLDGKEAVITRFDGSDGPITALFDAISKDWQSDGSGRYEIWVTNCDIPTSVIAGGIDNIQIDEIITWLDKPWRIDSIIESHYSDTLVKIIYDKVKSKEFINRIKQINK
jgi:hypothetical protein